MADYMVVNGYQDYYDAEEPEEMDPEFESLTETPEGLGYFPDQRDATPEPPAYLDPHWVIKMRGCIARFRETGVVDWMDRVAA